MCMKITLSKNQWQEIGKKAGWIKESGDMGDMYRDWDQHKKYLKNMQENKCPECLGHKFVVKKLKNLGTLDWVEHTLPCDTCNGKGYIDKEDIESRQHNEGVGPCPQK